MHSSQGAWHVLKSRTISETESFIMMLLHDDLFFGISGNAGFSLLFMFLGLVRFCFLFRGFGHSMSRLSLLLASVIG